MPSTRKKDCFDLMLLTSPMAPGVVVPPPKLLKINHKGILGFSFSYIYIGYFNNFNVILMRAYIVETVFSTVRTASSLMFFTLTRSLQNN
jgi:hypothetical protein